MFTDALTSIKAYLYDRAVSPLMGSFIVSWIIWNYKFILVLIAPISVYEKLWMFENAFYLSIVDALSMGLVFPLLTALAYLFLYPIPALKVYDYWLGQQKLMNDLKHKLNEGKLLTVMESREILKKIGELESDFASTLKEKNERIEALLNYKNNQNSRKEPYKNLSSTKIQILNFLKNSTDFISRESIYNEVSNDEFYIKEHAVDEMKRDGLIVANSYNSSFKITSTGRRAIIDHLKSNRVDNP